MHASPPVRSPIYRWFIAMGAVMIVVVLLVRIFGPARYAMGQSTPSTDLPKLSVVPPFALTERSGKTITNRDLSGKIWVADFIYTTCPGPCPIITAAMARFQSAVIGDPQVQLVTFTVDPDNDTPPVLATYADKFGADANRWWFLTGPKQPLYDLIVKGFSLAVQDNSGQPLQDGQYKVTHSTYLVLVDGDGNVRRYYNGVGTDNREQMLSDIKKIENEENQ